MIRKTLTSLSLIGLLLSVGLWGVSFVGMGFYEKFSNPLLSVSWVAKGSLHIHTIKLVNPQSYAPAFKSRFFVILGRNYRFAPSKKTTWHLLPVYWAPPTGELMMSVPLYIGILLFGAHPLWMALPFHRRRKRKKLGLCIKCGYDLRGSMDRCPECNTPFDHAKLGRGDLRSWRVRFLGALTHYSSLVFPLLMIFVVLMAFVIGSCLP